MPALVSTSAPVVHVQPAEQPTTFGSTIAAYLARRERCREIAEYMSIPVPHRMSDKQCEAIEAAYAEFNAEYAEYCRERDAEYDFYAAEIRAEEDADAVPPHCR